MNEPMKIPYDWFLFIIAVSMPKVSFVVEYKYENLQLDEVRDVFAFTFLSLMLYHIEANLLDIFNEYYKALVISNNENGFIYATKLLLYNVFSTQLTNLNLKPKLYFFQEKFLDFNDYIPDKNIPNSLIKILKEAHSNSDEINKHFLLKELLFSVLHQSIIQKKRNIQFYNNIMPLFSCLEVKTYIFLKNSPLVSTGPCKKLFLDVKPYEKYFIYFISILKNNRRIYKSERVKNVNEHLLNNMTVKRLIPTGIINEESCFFISDSTNQTLNSILKMPKYIGEFIIHPEIDKSILANAAELWLRDFFDNQEIYVLHFKKLFALAIDHCFRKIVEFLIKKINKIQPPPTKNSQCPQKEKIYIYRYERNNPALQSLIYKL